MDETYKETAAELVKWLPNPVTELGIARLVQGLQGY
jgi:hypothetical protein